MKAVKALAAQQGVQTGKATGPASPSGGKAWIKLMAGVVVLGFMIGAVFFNNSIKTKAKEGQPAPDFTAETLEGQRVKLSDYKGKTIFLNLWTTWCISCKEETFTIQSFHQRYGDKIQVIGLDVREPVDTLRNYMKETGMSYPILRDSNGNVPGRYNLRGYPESWFIDKSGIARKYWEGPMSFEQMQEFYQTTTGEPIDGPGAGPVKQGNHLHAVGISQSGDLLAGTHFGLFTSADGAAWKPLTSSQKLDNTDAMALAFPEGAPGTAFASGHDIGVLHTNDGGKTWSPVDNGLPSKDVHAMAASPDGQHLYAWVVGAGLHVSADGGSTWQGVPSLPSDLPVSGLTVDPANPDHLLVLAGGGMDPTSGMSGLFVSTDGGKSMSQVNFEEVILTIKNVPMVVSAAFDPENPKTVYFATHKGIWKSTDGGKTASWLRGSHMRFFTAIASAKRNGKVFLAAGAPNGDVYTSEDGGQTWRLEGAR